MSDFFSSERPPVVFQTGRVWARSGDDNRFAIHGRWIINLKTIDNLKFENVGKKKEKESKECKTQWTPNLINIVRRPKRRSFPRCFVRSVAQHGRSGERADSVVES